MSGGFYPYISNNEIFDLNLKESKNFSMDVEELPPERITVVILLSTAREIDTIKYMLKQSLLDSECEERGTVITLSGYPPNTDFNTNDLLAVAQKYDSGAVFLP